MNRGGSARSKKMKSLYCRIGDPVTKFSSSQSASSSRRSGLVQNELAERAVVAEVTLHQVEAGRQRSSLLPPLGSK